MIEAQIGYQAKRPRELVSSAGFSVEYDPIVTNQELRDDIISYLGEYRFELQKYDYQLMFSYNDSEGWKLRDPHRLESMGTKAKRSVNERKLRGESTHREEAEAIGISFLEKQLGYAREGNTIVWASPPGSKAEGYGDYGFFFIGQIKRSIGLKKEISMTAIRVEYPTIPQYNEAFQALTSTSLNFTSPEDFIKTPLVIEETLPEVLVDNVLSDFLRKKDPLQKDKFTAAIKRLGPRIEQFISNVRWGTKEEKKNAFHALENYALQIKKEMDSGEETIFESEPTFEDFVGRWGYEPPKVEGSCPIKSGNTLAGNYSSLNKVLDQEWFTCPKCNYHADGPIGNTCPSCGLTKEEFIKKGGAACE